MARTGAWALIFFKKLFVTRLAEIRSCNKNARSYCNVTEVSATKIDCEAEHDSTLYISTEEEYGTGKRYVIRKFKQLYDLTNVNAHSIALKYKKLRLVTGKTMSDNNEICKNNGITVSTILKYPEILAEDDLENRIMLLKTLPFNINLTAVLILLKYYEIQIFVERDKLDRCNFPAGRIGLLKDILQVSENTVCEILVEKVFLRRKELSKISSTFKTLIDVGITVEDIRKDLWIFRYSDSIIEEKLHFAKMNNVGKLKTWMVRSKPDILETYVKRRFDNRMILGDNTLEVYLSSKLDCSLDQAKVMISKHPALKNKCMRKMNEIIEFLYSKSFKPYHICRIPKILLHSVETTKKRLEELEKLQVQMNSLHILTKSRKQYMQYYESSVKKSKLKVS